MGIASNKLVAQIASKLRKPRGFVVVVPGEEAAFLEGLSVGRLPGIGAKTEASLARAGIREVRDLFTRGEGELAALFGQGWRGVLEMARGVDHSRVEVERDDAKSYSKQETFSEDEGDFGSVEQVVKRMVDELLPKIREDRVKVRTITIKVRYPDFSHESHGQSLEAATDLEAPFYPLVQPLLRSAWSKKRPLRLVGVRLSGVEDGPEQLQMFAERDEKRRKLADVMDKLNRGGRDAVVVRGHRLGGGHGM
jgi:DNA polymerase-4